MKKLCAGLGKSNDETTICAQREDGSIVLTQKTESEPEPIIETLRTINSDTACVILETGRMANWVFQELERLGLPVVRAERKHLSPSEMFCP